MDYVGIAATSVLIFLGTTIADIAWVLYIRRVSEGRAGQASFFSATIYLLGALIVTTYVKNFFYVIPAMFGTVLGTFLSVRLDSKRDGGHQKKR